jgi:hypothetical protein
LPPLGAGDHAGVQAAVSWRDVPTHGHARHRGGQAELPGIDRQIAALEREKAHNDQRLIAGVQSVAPALVVLSIVRVTFSQNVSIATGEWAGAIDRKLAELRRAKKSC